MSRDKNTLWQTVEKDVGLAINSRIKKNKEIYKQFKSISYGFVDGNLHYIRKNRKKKKEIVHFTSDDFKDFRNIKSEVSG